MSLLRCTASQFVRLFVTAASLAAIVWLVDLQRAWSALVRADLVMLAVAVVLTCGVLITRQKRWLALARMEDPRLSAGDAWRSYLAGLSLALVTPLAAGEVARGMFLPRGDRVRLASLVLVDKVVDLSWVALLGLAGWAWLEPTWTPALGLASAAIPAAWWSLTSLAKSRLATRMPPVLRRFAAVWASIGFATLARVALLSGLGFAFFFTQAWVVARALAPAASPAVMAVWPTVTLSTVLPGVLGGTGPRETTAALLASRMGLDPEVAAAAAFLQFLVALVLPAIIGLRWTGRAREAD